MSSFDKSGSAVKASVAAGALAVALVLALQSPTLLAQPAVQGQWRTLPYLMPINPVHLTLTNDGRVLIVAGSGNDANEHNFDAVVWDPDDNTFVTHALTWDMFCNGASVLPDGRVFINGGTLQYDPFFGEPRSSAYDPATGTFSDLPNMADGRWYPTTTTLGNGSVMTFSGLKATGGTNTTVEIYTPGAGWSAPVAAGWTPPLYPRMHLSTDGRVFYSGSGRGSRFFNPATMTWTAVVATMNYGNTRTYGTSVLLPLTPANQYRPRVMIFGGSNPATTTTEIIDLVRADSSMAVRTADVPGPDRDERHHPAERQSAGHWRIGERRKCCHREPQRGPLRPGYEHVQFGGRQRLSALVSFRVAAPSRRDRHVGGRKSEHVAPTSSTSRSTLPRISSTPTARRPCGRRSPV